MSGKLQWPPMASAMPDNIREYGHILGRYIDTTLALMADGHKPLNETVKSFFQATLTFITKTKKELNNQTILEEIQKAADTLS